MKELKEIKLNRKVKKMRRLKETNKIKIKSRKKAEEVRNNSAVAEALKALQMWN